MQYTWDINLHACICTLYLFGNLVIHHTILTIYSILLPTGVLEVENITPKYTWSEHSLPITSIHVGRGGKHANVVTSSLDHTCKVEQH